MTRRDAFRKSGVFAIVALIAAIAGPVARVAAEPAPDPAAAQARVDAARRDGEAVARRYFAQLDRYELLGTEIGAIEERIADIRRQSDGLRVSVARRALRAYKNGSTPVDLVLDGRDITALTRGNKLLAAANSHDDAAVASLRDLTDDLDARRAELDAAREAHSTALDELRAAQRSVDLNLRRALADQQAIVARLAVPRAADPAAGVEKSAPPALARATEPVVAQPVPDASPPDYTPRGGVHPHHDDAFLVCTRAREESNGQYDVVNPSGPYLGAYQFLQSTWNLSAQRAGRSELVGVPANHASEYDQDDVAWSLYQSQGNGPWGGLC